MSAYQRTSTRPVPSTLPFATLALAALTLTACGAEPDDGSEPQETFAQHPVEEELGLDLTTASLADISSALADGSVTSEQLVEAYTERIEALDQGGPALNSVRMLNTEAAEEAEALDGEREDGEDRGPLHGVPILLKDNIDVADLPTTAGSVALADSVPEEDAELVTALREAGAVILGKTNLSEFAYFMTPEAPSGYSSLGGQVLNPYDADQGPSGSSSGSAVAAAAALSAATVGSETSGSILMPAEANSVVGLKPTVELISQDGMLPVSATQDTAGPMARTVEDAALLAAAMTDGEAELSAEEIAGAVGDSSLDGVRLGYLPTQEQPEQGQQDQQPENPAAYEDALEVLEEQGAELVELDPLGQLEAEEILIPELSRDLDEYLAGLPEDAPMGSVEDIIAYNEENPEAALKFGQELLEEAAEIDLEDPQQRAEYEADREQGLQESRAAVDDLLEEEDLEAIVSDGATIAVGARAGYPSVSVPSGYHESGGRPAALVFLGAEWSDAELLSYAHAYEQAAEVWQPPAEKNPSLFRCTLDAVDSFENDCW